jgi:hypothetical protein
MQLLKQSRGNVTSNALLGWELFYVVASTMPPSKEFVGLVSEYVHTIAHHDGEVSAAVKDMAGLTWAALKRSAKAGTRRTVCTSSVLGSHPASKGVGQRGGVPPWQTPHYVEGHRLLYIQGGAQTQSAGFSIYVVCHSSVTASWTAHNIDRHLFCEACLQWQFRWLGVLDCEICRVMECIHWSAPKPGRAGVNFMIEPCCGPP